MMHLVGHRSQQMHADAHARPGASGGGGDGMPSARGRCRRVERRRPVERGGSRSRHRAARRLDLDGAGLAAVAVEHDVAGGLVDRLDEVVRRHASSRRSWSPTRGRTPERRRAGPRPTRRCRVVVRRLPASRPGLELDDVAVGVGGVAPGDVRAVAVVSVTTSPKRLPPAARTDSSAAGTSGTWNATWPQPARSTRGARAARRRRTGRSRASARSGHDRAGEDGRRSGARRRCAWRPRGRGRGSRARAGRARGRRDPCRKPPAGANPRRHVDVPEPAPPSTRAMRVRPSARSRRSRA